MNTTFGGHIHCAQTCPHAHEHLHLHSHPPARPPVRQARECACLFPHTCTHTPPSPSPLPCSPAHQPKHTRTRKYLVHPLARPSTHGCAKCLVQAHMEGAAGPACPSHSWGCMENEAAGAARAARNIGNWGSMDRGGGGVVVWVGGWVLAPAMPGRPANPPTPPNHLH